MSLEEKRQVFLSIFSETEDVFALKVRVVHRPFASPSPPLLTPAPPYTAFNNKTKQTHTHTLPLYLYISLSMSLCMMSPCIPLWSAQELEKIASKRGINSMIVKDILQGMADDDLIHAEKVGISTYYWCFPSEAGVRARNLVSQLERELEQVKGEKTKVDCELCTRQALVHDCEERPGLVEELSRVKSELDALQARMAKFADCDPEAYVLMKEAVPKSKEAVNRWVENIWALEGWMKKKFEGRGKEIDQFFKQCGVTDDLDTLP